MKKWIQSDRVLIGIILVCAVVVISILLSHSQEIFRTKSTLPVEAPIISEETNFSEPELKSYSEKLTSGHYIVGIDIPAGVYRITAQSGTGNVYSTNSMNGGLNEIMGTEKDDVKSFENADFPAGEVLSVFDVTIKIESDAADIDGMVKRENPAKSIKTLSSGNYVAGKDFDAGAYIITATKGKGNVYSDNTFRGINAIMAEKPDEMSIKDFKNVLLEDGTILTVSDVTIQIKPSK
ncbi:MAG: hypothetical protein E6593_16640 [Clostridium sp.]|nr:hypothetical protein [Clostridium sp.]